MFLFRGKTSDGNVIGRKHGELSFSVQKYHNCRNPFTKLAHAILAKPLRKPSVEKPDRKRRYQCKRCLRRVLSKWERLYVIRKQYVMLGKESDNLFLVCALPVPSLSLVVFICFVALFVVKTIVFQFIASCLGGACGERLEGLYLPCTPSKFVFLPAFRVAGGP